MPTYSPAIPRCQHIKVNGIQCGSPAKRNEKYCYFHEEARVECRRYNMRFTEHDIIKLPTLEDANSIQLGLGEVMRLLVIHQIDHKIASLLLRALRIAAANVKFTNLEPDPTHIVIDPKSVVDRPLGATAWSTVEGREFDLLQDHHLAAENGKTAQPAKAAPEARPVIANASRPQTPDLSLLEKDVLALEMAGKHEEAEKMWRKGDPFNLRPWRRSLTIPKVPPTQFNQEISSNNQEPPKEPQAEAQTQAGATQ